MKPVLKKRLAWLWPAALGALAILAFAPFNFWPLLPLSLALLFHRLLQQSPRQGAISGLLFGMGYFGAGVHWVYVSCFEFGQMGVFLSALVTLLLVLYLAIYPALFGGMVSRLWGSTGALPERHRLSVYLLGLPGIWMLLELMRGWLFTGFPWISVGYSQVDGPLAGMAGLIGANGIGWVLAAIASLLVMVLMSLLQRDWKSVSHAGLTLMLVIGLVTALSHWAHTSDYWTESAGEPLSVALVQGNVPQLTRWDADQIMVNIGRHLEASESFWGVDLLVWPENAIPAFEQTLPAGLLPALQTRSRESRTDLLTGMPLGDPVSGRYYNGINLISSDPDDQQTGQYRKRHLVPFGEYVPLRDLLGGMLDLLRVPMSAFSLGEADQRSLALRHSDHRIAPSICYEILFPGEVMELLPEAGLLVNISNDAWFGDSIAAHQHLQIARMRALESGRPLARATNSGITALVDWQGRIMAQSPQFKQTVLTGTLQPRRGSTPYVSLDDWPLRLLLMGSLGYLFWRRWRQQKTA